MWLLHATAKSSTLRRSMKRKISESNKCGRFRAVCGHLERFAVRVPRRAIRLVALPPLPFLATRLRSNTLRF